MENFSNRTIKGYELRERVGAGGFGAVYRAMQPAIGREVAIKVILPEHANQPDFVRRFELEAQLIARLEHPHIVPLYDYWRDPEGAFLVMRWLRGNLRLSLNKGAWSVETAARLLEQIGAALTVAHREGVIHRDIKPDNILLDEDDNAYLADFGIAKDLNVANITDEGTLVGSPAYLTPEQIKGDALTARTDIYSLGLVIYEILANETPFPEAKTPAELLARHLTTPIPRLHVRRPNLPAALDEVLQTATAKDPNQRYANVMRFASAFRAAVPAATRAVGQPLPDPLTERELDILRLITEGLTNQQICDRLVLSASTVKWYVKQIYTKLDVHSRQQAIARAKQLNLLESKRSADEAPLLVPLTGAIDASTAPMPPAERLEILNPYKGLRAFQEADTADFFGRAALVEQILTRMMQNDEAGRFLVVVGPSGSGKSSVVKAGLIPALRNGGLPASSSWFITDMLPGTHPLEELEAALLRVSVNPLNNVLEQLNTDRRGLVRAAKWVLPTDPDVELLLVIDQFEELFTLTEDDAVRRHFIDNLLAAATDPRGRVRIVLTLRADFYDRPLMFPRLAELVKRNTEVVLPLNDQELERAIVGPAERVGLMVEMGLVAAIVKEVGEQAGALPLLQYALTELFEVRQTNALTLNDYRETGGITGALARRADALFENLDDAAQAACRQLFLRLVTLGEGSEDTRRRVLQSEVADLSLDAIMDDVISVFAQYRLLTLDRDPISRGPTVEVAHEALIRTWKCLRDWLTESREDLRTQRRLLTAANEWLHSQRDNSFLASGARLIQFEALAANNKVMLNIDEKSYVTASTVERDRQQRADAERRESELQLQKQSANRLRYIAVVLAVFLVVAAGLSGLAFKGQTDANTNFVRAEAQRLAVESNKLRLQGGSSEVVALLALRSMKTEYSAQGDEALTNAVGLVFPKRLFLGHTDGIFNTVFSSDGKHIISGSADSTARVWDVETGAEIWKYTGKGTMYAVRFVPNSNWVIVGGLADNVLHVIDYTTNQEIRKFSTEEDGFYSANLIDGTKYLASTTFRGAQQTLRLWDFQSGQALKEYKFQGAGELWMGPDGHHAFIDDESGVYQWDTETWKPIKRYSIPLCAACPLAIAPDYRSFAIGTLAEFTITQYDAETGKALQEFKGHTSSAYPTAFLDNGQVLLTTSNDKSYRLWDVKTGKEVRQLVGHTGMTRTGDVSADGRYIVSCGFDKRIILWDLQADTNAFQFGAINDPTLNLALMSNDGQYIFTTGGGTTASLWDTRTGQKLKSFETANKQVVYGALLLPNGQAVTAGDAGLLEYFDLHSGKKVKTVKIPVPIFNMALSPDDQRILVSDNGDGKLHLFEADSGNLLQTFAGHNFVAAWGPNFSPDGKRVMSGSFDGTAKLWDVQSGNLLHQFDVPSGAASTAYSADGTMIATGGWDGMIRLWNPETGQQLREMPGHVEAVWWLDFSKDGRYLASGGDDGTARLWEVSTGTQIRRFIHHSSIQSVKFSPDGRHLLTASFDGTARLWFLDYNEDIRFLCTTLLRDFTDDERKQYSITDNEPTCPKDAGGYPPTWTPMPISTIPVWTPFPITPPPTETPTVTATEQHP